MQGQLIKRVVIVGGGIGGLVLAQLLRSSPELSVTVYERDISPDARGQGYYIGLQGRGLAIVKEKLTKLVPSLAAVISDPNLAMWGFAVLTSSFRTLMRLVSKTAVFESQLVSRWGLRASLARALPPGMIFWNKRVARYDERPNEVCVHFEDGSQATADLLVGAGSTNTIQDGVRSVVRAQRIPSLQVKEVGVANFGGRVPLTPALEKLFAPWSGLLIRVLGAEGHSLLILRYTTPEKQPMILWSISWPAKASDQEALVEWRRVKALSGKEEDTDTYSAAEREFILKMQKEVLRRAELHFKEPQVQNIVSSTAVEQLFAPQTVKSMETPPPPSAYAAPSRVFLLGDAAHAMTTHRGLGANTAIEDAADLAELLLTPGGATIAALPALQGAVFKRGFAAVAGSLQSTRTIHATGWAATFRNCFVWCLGTFILPAVMLFLSVKHWFSGSDKKKTN